MPFFSLSSFHHQRSPLCVWICIWNKRLFFLSRYILWQSHGWIASIQGELWIGKSVCICVCARVRVKKNVGWTVMEYTLCKLICASILTSKGPLCTGMNACFRVFIWISWPLSSVHVSPNYADIKLFAFISFSNCLFSWPTLTRCLPQKRSQHHQQHYHKSQLNKK